MRQLLPTLALAVKSVCSLGIVRTLANVYLGQDAGAKVVSGQIIRGAVESIDAVIWYSDLKNFTGISDQADADRPGQVTGGSPADRRAAAPVSVVSPACAT